MVGAWHCPNDDRVFILHFENNLSDAGIETLYLFQRYLIGFRCQEGN